MGQPTEEYAEPELLRSTGAETIEELRDQVSELQTALNRSRSKL